jgi:hypothetical protein
VDLQTSDFEFQVSDALGQDVTALQPSGEQRFDPATVGAMVALWLMKAVAEGVREGIQEASKDETKPVVTAVIAALKRRAPSYLKRPFQPGESGTDVLRRRQHEVQEDIKEARAVFGQLRGRAVGDLAGPIAVTVRDSLQEQALGRLPEPAAERVERIFQVQVQMLFEEQVSPG